MAVEVGASRIVSEAMSSSLPQRKLGHFIVFEGGDGSGKSTQAKLFAERIGAVLTREPGGTPISDRIRELVLNPDHGELTARTEALLMAASRSQHVEELIVPHVEAGQHVVSDRFVASSLAYQGIGRKLGVDAVADLNVFATAGLVPDLTILLDTEPAAARSRLGDELDRIEKAGAALGEQVANAYRRFAASAPDRWAVIDSNGSIEDVAARVAEVVHARIGL